MRHEVHLARVGFGALAAVALPTALVAGVSTGSEGAWSAAAGAAVVAGNHALAVASTGWSRTLGPRVVAIGYAGFFVRMLLVVAALAALASAGWTRPTVLAVSFCLALVATLSAECVSYMRGSYVPAWRSR